MKKTFVEKRNYLYIGLPIQYGEDSVMVERLLENLGYQDITEDNVDSAIARCRAELEYQSGEIPVERCPYCGRQA